MPNDFSGDSHCKALWNLESGALITDSKGSNTMTNYGVDEDTSDYKEGSCSGEWVRANTDRMSITDADLDSGFPLKSGESNKSFSFAFWFKTKTFNENFIIQKSQAANTYCFRIVIDAFWRIKLQISPNGINFNNYIHASSINANIWYHIGVTYNNNTGNYRIRIWDDNAGAIIGVDKTGVASDINISGANFGLGFSNSSTINGNLDEVVVFDDILSIADIDAIRAGTYSVGPPPETAHKFGSLISDESIEQKTGVFTEI